MATHDAWALVCRLFTGGTPILRAALSPREIAAVPALEQAVKPTALDQRFVLCPYCRQQRAQVWGGGHRARTCDCPECGPVAVAADDAAALMLDEDWLRRKLRLALSIKSRDDIDALGEGVWRLGASRRSPVLLARDLIRLWREPALLERVRVAGGAIRVITPKPRETRGADHAARRLGQRQVDRPLQGQAARQGQARGRGTALRLPRPRGHAEAPRSVLDAMRGEPEHWVGLMRWPSMRGGQPMAATHVQVMVRKGFVRVLRRRSWRRF